MADARTVLEGLLEKADIRIGGGRPGDLIVHNDRVYARILRQGSLGLGESYMDGWWDSDAIDETIAKILRAELQKHVQFNWATIWPVVKAFLFNLQSSSRARIVGEQHYDIGNDLYAKMLDKRMVYTCGYWKAADNLDDAQEAKLDLICRKVGLKAGDRVLDIGCGWGSFLKYAAERYGVSGVGITVSQEQAKLARENCKGLPIEIRVQDYRSVNEKFDHLVSIGMFEHVGYKNYRAYFEMARRCLKDDGLFLLHSIGGNRSVHDADPWINRYIFPNGMLPSIAQVGKAIQTLFVMEDWHNFGPYYDKTLMAWHKNFEKAWPELREKYDDRFYRMWRYYLLICAGTFRARHAELWQIVLSPTGVPGGYASIR